MITPVVASFFCVGSADWIMPANRLWSRVPTRRRAWRPITQVRVACARPGCC